MGVPPPATDPASAVLQLGPLALLAVLYARRAHTLARQRQAVPAWRQACWFGALALIALALTLLGSGSQELLVIHMAEHLLIGDMAAILIVLGLTGPLLAPVLRIGFFNRLRALSNPAIALPLWVLDLYVWHLPLFYEAALRNGGVHALEHVHVHRLRRESLDVPARPAAGAGLVRRAAQGGLPRSATGSPERSWRTRSSGSGRRSTPSTPQGTPRPASPS